MVNPHPKESHIVGGLNSEMTWLAYFAARCPMRYPAQIRSEDPFEYVLAEDCKIRIEWARTMLHALWPVPAQNYGIPGIPGSAK